MNNSPLGDGGNMEYKFTDIEKKWQEWWKEKKVYKVPNESTKPKYYVLDMFPYPSGAGLHVGHPLGYIASDIYARFKRLKGFNVLHPMGFDSFGLPAEQYALETGQHPAETTKKNIATFKSQLDKIGFCYDWEREVQTSDPRFYKWTQWIFLQLYNSYFCNTEKKALPVSKLVEKYSTKGAMPKNGEPISGVHFTADEWNSYSKIQQEEILMKRRLAYSSYGEVNWCEALGTVLANDEVVNGVSERGGHPVEKRKMRQWYLRITAYADRLLEGLEKVDFSDSMKEMQRNWIGKSSGAEMDFAIKKPPLAPPKGENMSPRYQTAIPSLYSITKKLAEDKRDHPTPEENIMWQLLKGDKTEFHIRRQHIIGSYIVDFACLDKLATIEIDGGYHNDPDIQLYDKERTKFLNENGFTEIRFTNEEVRKDASVVIKKIIEELSKLPSVPKKSESSQVSPSGGDLEGALKLRVYTTRPDTIFGVDFMVLAPEHELVVQITSADQKEEVEKYLLYVKNRSDRERQSEVKQITGCFTGAYAVNPFDEREIPIWIAEYVLAGYGTGAIMAVPCGDQRDFAFAKHFNIPITNIIGEYYNGEEANATKDAVLENSGFLNGILMKDAIDVAINKIEEAGIGKRKVNYKMRDAGFSRQRYWGEPFPIIWSDGIALPLDAEELPLKLPHVDKYSPGPSGEGPLSNLKEWVLIPNPSPQVEKGAARVPKYGVHMPEQYRLAKEMRKGHTEAEGIIWEIVRNNKLGVKFRRQHPIEAYIVDFICLQEKLIVEVDGGYHNNDEQKAYDEMRTKTLNAIGFEVIRFSNEEVINKEEEVKEKIKLKLAESANNPPLRLRRGVGGEGQLIRETSTMPGYAGSSWYFLRYMDPFNEKEFCSRKASDYWGQVDLYIGGTEHAVGHLLYSRMWTKFLFDLGLIGYDEPYKKLVNQGMIQGSSRFVYRVTPDLTQSQKRDIEESNKIIEIFPFFVSYGVIQKIFKGEIDLKNIVLEYKNAKGIYKKILDSFDNQVNFKLDPLHVNVNIVDGYELNKDAFKNWKHEYRKAEFINESDGKYLCGAEVEKMSKSKLNAVNPDDLVLKYGADTFRMYEMFLGPVEMSKPWDTKGIEGVHRFLKKLWRLFYDELKEKVWNEEKATDAELKVLHKTIRKIEEDTERFSFNTGVSTFMICVNDLTDLKCNKKEVLEQLLILLTPYAPHISEELWSLLGNSGSILDASFPKWNDKYLKETSKAYPVAINGKTRSELTIALDATQQQVEEIVLKDTVVQKWLEGKQPKKIIYVKNKMINVVL